MNDIEINLIELHPLLIKLRSEKRSKPNLVNPGFCDVLKEKPIVPCLFKRLHVEDVMCLSRCCRDLYKIVNNSAFTKFLSYLFHRDFNEVLPTLSLKRHFSLFEANLEISDVIEHCLEKYGKEAMPRINRVIRYRAYEYNEQFKLNLNQSNNIAIAGIRLRMRNELLDELQYLDLKVIKAERPRKRALGSRRRR